MKNAPRKFVGVALIGLIAMVAIGCTGGPANPEPVVTQSAQAMAAGQPSAGYRAENSNTDPWYLVETAPCVDRVQTSTDGLTKYVNLLAIQSATQADVYTGIFDVGGVTIMQSWHVGLHASGVYTIRVEWASTLHPSWVAAGGFVNGVLYRSDNCALLY